MQEIIADFLFFIQPSYIFSPPQASASTKGDMLSQALRHSPSGRVQPFDIKTIPSRISQACSMGFSNFFIRSACSTFFMTVILHFFIIWLMYSIRFYVKIIAEKALRVKNGKYFFACI